MGVPVLVLTLLAVSVCVRSAIGRTRPVSLIDLLGVQQGFDYPVSVGGQLFWLSSAAYCSNTSSLQTWDCAPCAKFGTCFGKRPFIQQENLLLQVFSTTQ
jgi:hypothetical protein